MGLTCSVSAVQIYLLLTTRSAKLLHDLHGQRITRAEVAREGRSRIEGDVQVQLLTRRHGRTCDQSLLPQQRVDEISVGCIRT